jgi:hypothetical protein
VSSSQTGFVNVPSKDTQSRAANFIDDQKTTYEYKNVGYKDIEEVKVISTQNSVGVCSGEKKREGYLLGCLNDGSTFMSKMQEISVSNQSEGNAGGENFGFEVQEETLWLRNDSDDNQSEKGTFRRQTSSEIDHFWIKKNVEPVQSREQVYEIKTSLLPRHGDQTKSVMTKQRKLGDAYVPFYHREVKQDFRNRHVSGSSLTLHNTIQTMENLQTKSEAYSMRIGDDYSRIKSEWTANERDQHGENLHEERISNGKKEAYIILKENEVKQSDTVPHFSERIEKSAHQEKYGEVNTKLTKRHMSESVENTRKIPEVLEEGKQIPMLTNLHKLGGQQQSSPANIDYKGVEKEILLSRNGSNKTHSVDIERTMFSKSAELLNR